MAHYNPKITIPYVRQKTRVLMNGQLVVGNMLQPIDSYPSQPTTIRFEGQKSNLCNSHHTPKRCFIKRRYQNMIEQTIFSEVKLVKQYLSMNGKPSRQRTYC